MTLALREIPCDSIRVVGRHRRDMGDLEAIANSISTVGLLHPPVVTEDLNLICGERRLRAMHDILGWTSIPVTVLQVSSIVEGEYDENVIRKDFTPSERVEIGKAVEKEIGNRQGQRTELRKNFAEVKGQRSADLAAQKAGFGNRTTYEQAKKVVEQAVDEVTAQMDAGDISISAAALIADQPADQQHEIARLPKEEKKTAVRTLRHKGLPTPISVAEVAERKRMREIRKAMRDHNMAMRGNMPKRQTILENAAKNRMITAVSHAHGISRGLPELNIQALHNQCSDKEIKECVDIARAVAKAFSQFAAALSQSKTEAETECPIEAGQLAEGQPEPVA